MRALVQICVFVVLILGHGYVHAQTSQVAPVEKILNKQDADHIFSLNRAGWEKYAQRMVHPAGWEVRLSPHDTGTTVMAFDPSTNMGLSVQPLYYGNSSRPGMLIVGSYYPLGSLPRRFDDDFKRSIERATLDDLGSEYSVSATYVKFPRLEGIELAVTRK